MRRPAFAILETIVVIAILGIVSTLSIPLYRQYQVRNDLALATAQVTGCLQTAQRNAQAGNEDDVWSCYVPEGRLFKGDSLEERDTVFDRVSSMPESIRLSGSPLLVTYSKLKGIPHETGTITLTSVNGDIDTVVVSISVDTQQVISNAGDTLTICHKPGTDQQQTMQIPEAARPGHEAHGDTIGPCPGDGGAASSVSSSVSSAGGGASSSGGGSSSESGAVGSGGTGESSACTDKFTVSGGVMQTTSAVSVTFTNLESLVTYGPGGPQVPVHVCYSTNAAASYSPLFGGNGQCKGSGNAYGNAVQRNGTDVKTVSIAANKDVIVRVTGRYKQGNWLAFLESYNTNDGTGHIELYRNGDTIPDRPGYNGQQSLRAYLTGKSMLDGQNHLILDPCAVLGITELGTLDSSAADYQDDVFTVLFQ